MAKKGHGHHGGAWKVAYADFVTAMMALFLVLWLTKQDEKIKQAVERAFRQPYAIGKEGPSSMVPKDGKESSGSKSGEGSFQDSSHVELAMLRKLNDDLIRSLRKDNEDLDQNTFELKLSSEGLRISIFDRNRKPVFQKDNAQLTSYGTWVFQTLAWEISRYTSFQVELEGHTEKGFQSSDEQTTAWELTAGRANGARRKLVEHGVVPTQIRKVAGFADTQPLAGHDPSEDINRRVSVLLKIRSVNPGSSHARAPQGS